MIFNRLIRERLSKKVTLQQNLESDKANHWGVRKSPPIGGNKCKDPKAGMRERHSGCLVGGKEASVIAASVQKPLVVALGVC